MDYEISDFGKSILKMRKLQNEAFLNKVMERNRKEAKIIITRYDLKNSLLFVQDFSKDWNYNLEQINNLMKKRGEFLKELSEYL